MDVGDVPIYVENPYGNSFSKIAIVCAGIWVGAIILKNAINPSTSKQYHQDKRYTVKSKNKINTQIEAKNRAMPLHPKINIFNRNKRFNRYF